MVVDRAVRIADLEEELESLRQEERNKDIQHLAGKCYSRTQGVKKVFGKIKGFDEAGNIISLEIDDAPGLRVAFEVELDHDTRYEDEDGNEIDEEIYIDEFGYEEIAEGVFDLHFQDLIKRLDALRIKMTS